MKKPFVFILVILSVSFAACKQVVNSPTQTASSNEVATQVSEFLTLMPSQTSLPQPVNTGLPVFTATSTQSPTSISATSTPQVTPSLNPTTTSTIAFTGTTTSTPVITATFSPTDPRQKLGTPTWEDTFKNDWYWPTGSDTYTSIDIKNNSLSLTALTQTDGWRLAYPKTLDFYLEATIRSDNCAASDHFGLIFRVPDQKTANQGYLAGISCDGQFSLRKWDGVKMTNLIAWTSNSVINSGAGKSNRLGVMAVGDHLGIYVNGTLLAESRDSSFSAGVFGVFVGGKTSGLTMTLTAIAYWENP
jgi:hypothetical protein